MFLKLKFHISPVNSIEMICLYYPELKNVINLKTSKEDEFFDILLLGGSVLNRIYDQIKSELPEQLKNRTNKKIRIHNLAASAHSSLDSKIKFELLKEKYFDFVIFYHGINEVRANNCPDSIFKPDYSHYSWHKDIYNVLDHKEIKYTVIPYMIDDIIIKLKQKFGIEKYVPTHRPDNEWIEYGKNVKTPLSFKKNILDIIHIAKSNKVPVLIMTFAYYIPADYNPNNYDPAKFAFPIELWGKPSYVKAGIEAHNEVIRDIYNNYNNDNQLYYLDMESLINKSSNNFVDICHFTSNGSAEFISYLSSIIKRYNLFLRQRRGEVKKIKKSGNENF